MARNDAISSMRELLLTRRDALRKALSGDLSLLRELNSATSGDVADCALDAAQDELTCQLAEVEARELTSIDNALQRMRDGEYGGCETCGCEIPLARLQALPYATMCIQCQREAERQGVQTGIPLNWARVSDADPMDLDVPVGDLELS
ncbi:MAG: TraR/DksA family transcriptional regulator [bacterium]|nr:TraR/DksA family transcriptional regulator [bacterium]